MNFNYYDLYYNFIRNRDEKVNVDNQCENKENDYIIFSDTIPNHYVRRKKKNEILR